ncbi:cytochrome P450 71A1 [Selaginella moellendorffii]|uniref:cytochrome P450 71A1 n=1 Tax=Selaginella moellendorffii TaxID=88036 RepID=UPI000D1C30CA|nr:cytochrome P450 71A1 [Selaginella moellendorffii]|eukprot:XP_024520859.1 cytochrome P450 71A1 [Selaginella moellendorffii]
MGSDFVLVVAAALLIAAVLWKLWKSRIKSSLLPPGPIGLPLIGHLHLLFANPPHTVLQRLSARHGPIMSLRFGHVPVVVASSPAAAKEFLKTHDAAFASRPLSAVGRIFVHYNADIAFAPYGDSWRHLRKIATLELLTARRIDMFQGARMEEVRSMCQSLLGVNNCETGIVDVRGRLSALTFNLITFMLMGKRYFGKDAENDEGAKKFLNVIAGTFEVCGEFPIGDYFPWLPKFLDPAEHRMHSLAKSLHEFLMDNISEHENKRNNSEKNSTEDDFLDILLSLRDNGDERLQNKNIISVMTNLVAAGTETSAVTLEWAMAESIKNPTIAAKAREEIELVLGEKWMTKMVEEHDLSQLTYLQAIVKETLRLHPAVPLLVPHQSTQPVSNVMGYHIPRGTTVLINAYAIARDTSAWGDDALLFRPERFLGTDLDIRGRDFEAVPFGSGRRQCPGMALALTTVHLTLANLLHGFEWREPSGESIDTSKEQYGLTLLMANKLRLISTPRLEQSTF